MHVRRSRHQLSACMPQAECIDIAYARKHRGGPVMHCLGRLMHRAAQFVRVNNDLAAIMISPLTCPRKSRDSSSELAHRESDVRSLAENTGMTNSRYRYHRALLSPENIPEYSVSQESRRELITFTCLDVRSMEISSELSRSSLSLSLSKEKCVSRGKIIRKEKRSTILEL